MPTLLTPSLSNSSDTPQSVEEFPYFLRQLEVSHTKGPRKYKLLY